MGTCPESEITPGFTVIVPADPQIQPFLALNNGFHYKVFAEVKKV